MASNFVYFNRSFVKPDGRSLHLFSLRPISEKIAPTNPPHEPITGASQLRWHPLRGEWVAFAGHRQNRTFLPPKEYSPLAVTRNPDFPTELPAGDYDMAVFENLFPSLSLGFQGAQMPEFYTPVQPGFGSCEVVVFTQDPDTSLGALPLERVQLVVKVWAERTKALAAQKGLAYILPFENRGVEVGVTLHHPHGQIYCYPVVPPLVEKMVHNQREFWKTNKNKSLLLDMVDSEIKDGRRLIHQSKESVAFIPVCARYPYETWIVPKTPVAFLHEMSDEQLQDFAASLKAVLQKLDSLWQRPMPYLMSVFQAPTDGSDTRGVQTHIQIFPALRTKDKLKFLAGTELAAGLYVNDSYPEEKAAELRQGV